VIAYRATLDVPRELVRFVAGLLRAERRRSGTRRDTRISRATAYRYLDEGIAVLATRALDLREALDRAKTDGLPY
jgi:hypothetical protein